MKSGQDLLLSKKREVFFYPKTVIMALIVTGELLPVSSLNLPLEYSYGVRHIGGSKIRE